MKVVALASIVVFAACGMEPQTRSKIKIIETEEIIEQCSVVQVDNAAVILCPDGTSATVTPEIIETTTEVEVPVVTEKVIRINADPVYVGYYCSRNVIRIGSKVYLISSGLVRLGSKWTKVSSSCDIRYRKNQVETK